MLVKFVKSRLFKLVVPLKASFPKELIVFGSFNSAKFAQSLNNWFDKLVICVLLKSALVIPEPWNKPVPSETLLLFANTTFVKFVVSRNDVFPIERKLVQFVKSSFVNFELRNESFPIVCKAEFSGKTNSLMFDPQKALLLMVVKLAGNVNTSGASADLATSVKALFWIVFKASH